MALAAFPLLPAEPERWRFEPRGYGRSLTYHPFEGKFNEWAFVLHRVEPGADGSEARHLLDEEDIAFVLAHGLCFYCRRRFTTPLRECECRKAFWADCGGEIYACHPKSAGRLADRVFDRQKNRDGRARRTALVRAIGGKQVTAAEKAALFRAQASLCYFCGDPMVEAGPGKYHHDHFVPIARGGRDELENAVLACGQCNTRKGAQTGLEYIARLRRRRLSAAPFPWLLTMRRALGRWRHEQGFRAFAHLPVDV